MTEQFGERITVADANKYIEAYDQARQGISSFTPPTGVTNESQLANIAIGSVYANSKFNCFIFRKSLVDELMALKDRNGKTPEYLLIHFAAHPKDKENPGEPTLVILGCNQEKAGEYISMKDPNPGGETPGKIAQATFPPELIGDTIVFKLKS